MLVRCYEGRGRGFFPAVLGGAYARIFDAEGGII